ncbi:ebs-bah-phd domain-containing protein [Diplodia corticola]|uniref:Ebs-bah-phd domain-containing protein n=1 Tax=Diplodia corticola TaxID=236234 RepID=A0A1J9QK45_9PEZI|nr:ebs-bah-phd domain-containing protein [Diplodia corticola]OJD28849.1 ebs-bah-phd domain-containing protein [Diplodia corticola]
MADPMPPKANARAARSQSAASSRRGDSVANDRPSSTASDANGNGNPAADRDDDQREEDKKELPTLDWSKFHYAGFTVKHHSFPTEPARPSKKRKRSYARKPVLEDNAFDESMQVLYTVEPAKWWDDTRRYRKFTIAGECFRLGDTVFVKPAENELEHGHLESWVAKVLEVRAASEQHVFLRIMWLYRPEDLPGGRRPYHGQNEVVASNRMQIIDALTVNGKTSLTHWTEEDGDDVLDADQLYWRQTYDWAYGKGTNVLSSLRKHCIDDAPFNPDSVLVHCDSCNIWLHAECLEMEAVKQAHADKGLPEPTPLPSPQPEPCTQAAENGVVKSEVENEEVKAEDVAPVFEAEVKTEPDGKSYILLKGIGGGHVGEEFEKAIYCLKCRALIE